MYGRKVQWSDAPQAALPPRLRVERFKGKMRRRVQLLGDIRCKVVHFTRDENTMPCLAPGERCPFCEDARWKTRNEFYVAALELDKSRQVWEPIVAVLTPGGWNKLNKSELAAS